MPVKGNTLRVGAFVVGGVVGAGVGVSLLETSTGGASVVTGGASVVTGGASAVTGAGTVVSGGLFRVVVVLKLVMVVVLGVSNQAREQAALISRARIAVHVTKKVFLIQILLKLK